MLHDGLYRLVRHIIRRDIDRLEGCDGTVRSRVNTLLHLADVHLDGCRITVLDGHTVHHGTDLRISLYITVYIVDKQKHILFLLIPQILSQCKTTVDGMGTGCGVVTHLSKYHGHLIQKSCLCHLVIQLTALTGTLTDTDKDRVGTQSLVYVMDQLFNQYGFSDTGTAQKTHLKALSHRCKEIQHLDAGPEDLSIGIDLGQAGA